MICYKITNLITGKSYVGITMRSIEQRFIEHCYSAHYGVDYILYRSMRKYGIENFIIEEVANAIGSDSNLYELEKHVILQENTEIPHGYNMTSGGENPPSQKGKDPWNKGKVISDEVKRQMNVDGLKFGHGWNKGMKMSPMNEETKAKISNSTKGKNKPDGFSEKIKQSWIKRKAAKAETNLVLNKLTTKELS